MNNRRAIGRYSLLFQVRIRLKGERRNMWDVGQTQNISSRGVYLSVKQSIPVGSDIEMYFRMPENVTLGKGVFIHIFGRVRRIEEGEKGQFATGVAATITKYHFTRE